MKLFDKIFGSTSERELKKIEFQVEKVLSLEDEFSKLKNEDFKIKTTEFKERLRGVETLEDILPEAFALVREAAWRVLSMKPYKVQVIGGIVLHNGNIAEMKTGEGKTLVATMPTYLNALSGEGAFVITVNEYLAKRDKEQMGKVFKFLGLETGLILNSMTKEERKKQYKSDIVYSTNNEIGFDYLKDNMAKNIEDKVQRGFNYAIIDEVDSILIDEARTPLIISGEGDDVSTGYIKADKFVRSLKGTYFEQGEKTLTKLKSALENNQEDDKYAKFDYVADEKENTVSLTDKGIAKAEKYYNIENLGDIENIEINHYISKALKAHSLFKKDINYVVDEGEIVIIDEHTGRLMPGRRYSEGIHQAIETKEKVEIKKESKTLASISFQNLFKKFKKLSGMTGTAMTEADEFRTIYGLEVIEIPTNKPVIRLDENDKIFINKTGKLNAIIMRVIESHEKGQPILIGTTSVENSEFYSAVLKKIGVKHKVLNAKNHKEEASIIAQAGHLGAVTIATNMAGRGTDIMLGGNPEYLAKDKLLSKYDSDLVAFAISNLDTDDKEIIKVRELYHKYLDEMKESTEKEYQRVKEAGGLFVLGTERHTSRRIDNQLRGRSGRQGDPGNSEFLISLQDDLMRIFGADKINNIINRFNFPEDIPINVKMVSNSIEQSQKRIESIHFQTRKHLMEYDSVMNIQRETIYESRDSFLEKDHISEEIIKMLHQFIDDTVYNNIQNKKRLTLEDQEAIKAAFEEIPELESMLNYTENDIDYVLPEELIDNLKSKVDGYYNQFEKNIDDKLRKEYEKRLILFLIDTAWQDHLISMDDLKEGIGLQALGQNDPLMIYKLEAFKMFEGMINYVKTEILKNIIFYSNIDNRNSQYKQ